MSHADKQYRLERNKEFGFYQVSPTPPQDEITKFYADEFYSKDYKNFNNSALDVQLLDKEFHDAHREDICIGIQQLSQRPISGLRILDIGCGWAQTLCYLKQKGAQCYGFDPAPEAVAYAQSHGIIAKQAGMESVEVFPGETFDVVMLLNVLEHLADPISVMREIRQKVIKQGGIVIVEVPNEFNAFQVCGQRLHGLNEWWVSPPAHLNYFSAGSLKQLLEGTGYDVRIAESAFPLEMFLLFGDNYVADPALGRRCHERRMAFEMNLRKHGFEEVLHAFYQALADRNLGRQVLVYAVSR